MEKPFLKLPFEYKGIVYDVFKEEHLNAGIQNLINEFALRETMNKAVGLTQEEFLPFAEEICRNAVEEKLSIAIIEKNSGKLVAPLLQSDFNEKLTGHIDIPIIRPIMGVLSILVNKFENNYSEIVKNEKIINMNILAIPESYAGRGVSFTAWFAALVTAFHNGYKIIVACPSDGGGKSGSTCLEKMKFQKLYEVRYQDYEYEGKKVFSGIKDAECCFFAMRTLHSQEELWEILGNKTINLDI